MEREGIYLFAASARFAVVFRACIKIIVEMREEGNMI